MSSTAVRRLEPLALIPLLAVYGAWWLASDAAVLNPDTFYHLGVARLYAQHGWLGDFPWLGSTLLGPGFPNAYLLLHLVLLPFAALLPPDAAIPAATLALSLALLCSVILVLRRWRVSGAFVWAVGLALSSNLMIIWAQGLKGVFLFLILFVWILDAIWAGAWRRCFVLTWLSFYSYVGAPVVLGAAVVWVAVARMWDGKLDLRPLGAVAAGVLAGLIVNPFWPDQWRTLAFELRFAFAAPPEVRAPDTWAQSWMPITTRALLIYAGPVLALWAGLLVRQGQRAERTESRAVAGAIVSLGLLAASLYAGMHLLQLFFVTSLLFLPLLAHALGPWPRWAPGALGAAGAATAVWATWLVFAEIPHYGQYPRADYSATAALLERETADGEVVLVPWDEFPGLFYYGPRNHFVSGLNPGFLFEANPVLFRAYHELYRGRIADPEKLLPGFFPGTTAVVVRAEPPLPGEARLAQQLVASPHFGELPQPAKSFRVFKLRSR